MSLLLVASACSAVGSRPTVTPGEPRPTFATTPTSSPTAAPIASPIASPNSGTAIPQADGPSAAELAQELTNPVANLYSFPFQLNYDQDLGVADDGDRWQLNVQPVLPFDLNEDWLVISRTILPVIWQNDVVPSDSDQSGIGDIVQSAFFSPKGGANDLIWGVGPVLLLPTASDDLLGQGKWGAGPTGVVLRIEGPWTYGGLANHLWSFAGDDDRPEVNASFVQPFVSYTTPSAYTFSLTSETTYNWRTDDWAIPFNFTVARVTRFGKLPVSVGVGLRWWAESPDAGAEGLGLRLQLTPLLPR